MRMESGDDLHAIHDAMRPYFGNFKAKINA